MRKRFKMVFAICYSTWALRSWRLWGMYTFRLYLSAAMALELRSSFLLGFVFCTWKPLDCPDLDSNRMNFYITLQRSMLRTTKTIGVVHGKEINAFVFCSGCLPLNNCDLVLCLSICVCFFFLSPSLLLAKTQEVKKMNLIVFLTWKQPRGQDQTRFSRWWMLPNQKAEDQSQSITTLLCFVFFNCSALCYKSVVPFFMLQAP